jgi:DNA-binding SARP family transcriptional activator
VVAVSTGDRRVGRPNVRLLGCFEVLVDDEPKNISLPAQRLLAMLALEQGGTCERSYVAGTLWPDSAESAARSNLRSALSNLGRLRGMMIEIMPGSIRLAPHLRVDLYEHRERASRLLDPDDQGNDVLVSAFASDLLPHWDEVWVESERESYRQLRVHVLERLSDRLTKLGRYAEGIQAALLAVDAAPLRESAHRAVINALAAEGNRGEAMARYTELCDLLDRELGVEPSFRIDDVFSQFAKVR